MKWYEPEETAPLLDNRRRYIIKRSRAWVVFELLVLLKGQVVLCCHDANTATPMPCHAMQVYPSFLPSCMMYYLLSNTTQRLTLQSFLYMWLASVTIGNFNVLSAPIIGNI